MTADPFKTVHAPVYVDVLDRHRKGVRIVVVAPLKIPIIPKMEMAVSFFEGHRDERTVLYGHAGRMYAWKNWPRATTPSGQRNYFFQTRCDETIGPLHAIRRNTVGDWSDRIVGQWGSIELEGYDLRAATALVERLRRKVLEEALVAEGCLLWRSPAPSWWADPETCSVALRHGERGSGRTPNENRFSLDRAEDARRFVEALAGGPARINGRVENDGPSYTPRLDLPVFARDVAGWATETAAQDAAALPGDLLLLWHDLYNAARDVPPDAAGACEVLRSCLEFVDRVIGEGTAGLRCLENLSEHWAAARRRIVEIEGVADPIPTSHAAIMLAPGR